MLYDILIVLTTNKYMIIKEKKKKKKKKSTVVPRKVGMLKYASQSKGLAKKAKYHYWPKYVAIYHCLQII